VLDEIKERIKNPGRKCHSRAVPAEEQPFFDVETEIAELENRKWHRFHFEPEIFRKISSLSKDFQTGLSESCHERTDRIPLPAKVTKGEKRTKEKNQREAPASSGSVRLAMAGGRMRTRAGSSRTPDNNGPPEPGKKGTEL
jgi:hypothetical protein